MVIGVSYGAISCKVIRFSLPKEARGGAGRVQKPSGYKERRKNKYSFSSSSAGTKEELETGESSVDETPLRKVIIQFRCFFVDFFMLTWSWVEEGMVCIAHDPHLIIHDFISECTPWIERNKKESKMAKIFSVLRFVWYMVLYAWLVMWCSYVCTSSHYLNQSVNHVLILASSCYLKPKIFLFVHVICVWQQKTFDVLKKFREERNVECYPK